MKLRENIAIDEAIRPLVEVLNAIPAVETVSSCGGHDKPSKWQLPANEWYVDLSLRESRRGWHALALLADVVFETDGAVSITPWVDGGLRFDLRGRNYDPDAIITAIIARLEH